MPSHRPRKKLFDYLESKGRLPKHDEEDSEHLAFGGKAGFDHFDENESYGHYLNYPEREDTSGDPDSEEEDESSPSVKHKNMAELAKAIRRSRYGGF